MKERGKEHEKQERKSSQKKERPPVSRDEEEIDGEIRLTKAREDEGEVMEILDKKEDEEKEAEAGRQVQEGADKKEYLDRFRQHMCRLVKIFTGRFCLLIFF